MSAQPSALGSQFTLPSGTVVKYYFCNSVMGTQLAARHHNPLPGMATLHDVRCMFGKLPDKASSRAARDAAPSLAEMIEDGGRAEKPRHTGI